MTTFRVMISLCHDDHSEEEAVAAVTTHRLALVDGLESVWVEDVEDGDTDGDFAYRLYAKAFVEAPNAAEAAARVFGQVKDQSPMDDIDGLYIDDLENRTSIPGLGGFTGGWLPQEWLDEQAAERRVVAAR